MNKTEIYSTPPGVGVKAFGLPIARRLNPKKLLLSKWTAATPYGKEKHFIVTRVIPPEPPATRIERIELEPASARTVSLRVRPPRVQGDAPQPASALHSLA